jgi:ABC-type multidrug transport system fused ATPase/permease subunit
LFNRTIRENIAYGAPGKLSDAAVRQAAQRAQALEFIEQLPEGFDSLVGERGVKLSGGQRQRVAIARAMLSEAPLVVLDEATSALDSANEQLIQKALSEVMAGRTAVVIAHRLSTLQHLDRIIVLDGGRVVQTGTHAQLLAAEGIYADLWRRQKDGFIGD